MGQLANQIQTAVNTIPQAPVSRPADLLTGPELVSIFQQVGVAVAALETQGQATNILRVTSKPTNLDGQDNDLAINILTTDFYAKQDGEWVLLFRLKGEGTTYHVESFDPEISDGQDGDVWQTAVSLTTERRFKRVKGVWRKFYDNVGVPTGPVNAPPKVQFNAPSSGATLVKDQLILLTITATDDTGVESVEIFNGATGVSLGTANKNGNTYTLNYTPSVAGPLTFSARATDLGGLTTTASVSVNVGAGTVTPVNTPPKVQFNAPASGATLTKDQVVLITVTATDDTGVDTVEIFNGATGVSLGTANKNGNTYTLNYTPSVAGTLTFSARATDVDGLTTSANVTVNVSGGTVTPVNTPPSALVQVGGTSSVPKFTAIASDSDGIKSIFIKLFDASSGATVQTFGPSAPGDTSYIMSWTNAPAGSYIARAVATDTKDLSSTSDAVPFTVSTPVVVPTFKDVLNSGDNVSSLLFTGGTGVEQFLVNFPLSTNTDSNPAAMSIFLPSGEQVGYVDYNGADTGTPCGFKLTQDPNGRVYVLSFTNGNVTLPN